MNEVRHNDPNDAEVRLVANKCPQHKDARQRTNPYKVYGKYAPKFIKSWEDGEGVMVIDPTVASEKRLGHWLYMELPIIVPCGVCDRLTLHTYVSGKGWISIPPEGWRSRVTFQWDQDVSHKPTMENVCSISLNGISGKGIRMKLVRSLALDGDVIDPHREPFKKVVQVYLFGTEREFLVRFRDLLQTTLLQVPDYYTGRTNEVNVVNGEVETLVNAIQFAIQEIEGTKRILKSAKLGEIRSRLQSAIFSVVETDERFPWRRNRIKLQ